MKKQIIITPESSSVESRFTPKIEEKIRERMKIYRAACYSDETLIKRYKNYLRRYHSSGRYYDCGSADYCEECLVMMEVFRRLAEERKLYINETEN